MDQKSEFSKWMKTIESALSGETKVEEEILEQGSCGCGAWNCPDCFPDDNNDLSGLEGKQIKAIITIQPDDAEFGEEMLQQPGDEKQGQQQAQQQQQQGVGMAGTHPVGQDTYDHDDSDDLDVTMPLYGGEQGIDEEGDDDTDVELTQQPLPRTKDGAVKLGDIVQKYVPVSSEGEDSPLTDGSELDEDDDFSQPMDDTASDIGTMQGNNNAGPDFSQEDADDQIQQILNVQSLGLSNADANYSDGQLRSLPSSKLKSIHQQVIGGVQEATMTAADDEEERPKPTKTRTKRRDDLDAFDDILGVGNDQPLDNYREPGQQGPGGEAPPAGRLPGMRTASADATRRATSNIRPDAEMMNWMNRINPNAGGDEAELPVQPVQPEQNVVLRTARDVPAVISHAMQAAGMASPEWHTINNLPGYNHRNIRGMGRNVFGMFTSTPLEQIKTIANVNGQGPNTDAEIRAVASFLINNAEDLGDVHLDHGEAIPGYAPDVKEYSIDGVRFHVVRDQMGQYIYAYPDADARINTNRARLGGQGGGPAPQGRLPGGRPQLREGSKMEFKLSITEAIKLDDIIREGLRDIARQVITESEVDEAKSAAEWGKKQADKKKAAMTARGAAMPTGNYPLSRRLANMPGAKNLIDKLHKTHKLSNEAELEPVSVTTGKDAVELAWGQFNRNPDDFVIVSGRGGVAGIKPEPSSVQAYIANAAKKGKEPNFSKHAGAIQYQVIAYTDDGQRVPQELLRQPKYSDDRYPDPTQVKARMGLVHGRDTQNPDNIFNLLDRQIGPITTVWIAGWAGNRGGKDEIEPHSRGAVERDKINKRAELKKGPADLDQNTALKTVFKRVRPVMKKLAAEAMSMLTRSAQRSMNGGDMETAEKLMTRAKRLKQFSAILDTSADINLNADYGSNTRDFTNQLQNALAKAANTRIGSAEYKEFLNAAATGNAMALKPVLDALRDNLVEL